MLSLNSTTGCPTKFGRLLICEDYPGMRDAFDLMLGDRYELAFVDSQEEIVPFLAQFPVRLVIWDLNRGGNPLQVLRRIRRIFPELRILLIAGEFEYDLQIAAIQQCGDVRFLTKPWKSTAGVLEQVQAMLGDRESSIHHRILRVSIAPRGDA